MLQKRLLVPLFLVIMALLAIPYVAAWFSGQVFGTFDLAHITIPIEDLYARYQARGEVPVWTPEFQGGFPMMANGFQSFFYLPHIILRAFLPGVWVANISLLLHAWLAAAGMWLLLRYYGLSRPALVAGSILYAGGGYFMGHITLPHLFFPAAFLPLILWLALRFWDQPTAPRAVAVAAASAAQLFSGHVQMVLYTAVMLGVLAAVEAASRQLKMRHVRWGALIPVLFLALVAVHLLPLQELLPLSKRGEALEEEEAYSVSYPFSQVGTWVKSDALGTGATYHGAKNEQELLLYFGYTGVVLGFLGGWVTLRKRPKLGFVAVAVLLVGWLIGAGEYSPVYRMLHELPTFLSGLANPGRAMVLVHLAWSILGALGISVIKPKFGYLIASLMAVEIIGGTWGFNPGVTTAAWARTPLLTDALSSLTRSPRIYSHTVFAPAGEPDFTLSVGPRLDQARAIEQGVRPERAGWNGVQLGVTWDSEARQGAEIVVQVRDARDTITRETRVNAENITADQPLAVRFAPIADSAQQAYTIRVFSTAHDEPQPHIRIYANTDGDFNPTGKLATCTRVACTAVPGGTAGADAAVTLLFDSPPVIAEQQALVPIFGEGFGYPMIRGHMQLQLQAVSRYLYELGEQADFLAGKVLLHRTLLDRYSAGGIVALWPDHRFLTDMPGTKLLASAPVGDRYVRLYRNEQAWPRLAAARKIQVASSVDDTRRQLVENEVPSDTVVLVGSMIPPNVGDSEAELNVTNDTSRMLALTMNSRSPQLLVVRDVVFPGWRAAVDGVAVPIHIVDSLFRGVFVPAGQHEITFTYEPGPYRIGAVVSGAAWLAVAGLGLYAWRRRAR